MTYTFHRIEPLPHLPEPATARDLLTKLSNDPAIRHVMQQHRFSVGVLTELAPHEHPNLLGLNVNAGQAIKLRVRTDAYDGFRTYNEIRRVLCHELTHNVWGNHDNNVRLVHFTLEYLTCPFDPLTSCTCLSKFKELNSQLNREVLEFERAQSIGTHYLTDTDSTEEYMPSSQLEAEARAHVLGSSDIARASGGTLQPISGDSREDMRRRILEATVERLRKEEEELEQHCGTTAQKP